MCGITLTIRLKPLSTEGSKNELFNSLNRANAARGPDSQSSFTHLISLWGGGDVEVCLTASVLGLRGSGVTQQPIIGERGVLAWNGQVFDGLDVSANENDTRRIFDLVEAGDNVASVLSRIEGPYAFVYLDLKESKVYYQVDPLSRRSLLIHDPIAVSPNGTESEPGFVLSSTRSSYARAAGVEMRALLGGEGGMIDLRKLCTAQNDGQTTLDFSAAHSARCHLATHSEQEAITRVMPINSALPPDPIPPISDTSVTRFHQELEQSVKRRVENIPPPSSHLEARAAILFSGGVDSVLLAYMVHQWLPSNEPIDLINVAFQQGRAQPLSKLNNGDDGKESEHSEYDVPDRIGGRTALLELQSVTPGRQWRFVEIDVTQLEFMEKRQEIVDLMYPCTTEMDLSLASPFYFASRGIGHIRSSSGEKTPHLVKAKVYFSGLGPDEQLAGYSRHRQAFLHRGWPGLIEEVQIDVSRLSTRNTSRDDRVLSHFARDARFPYLDLSFIHYLSSLPLWEKCDPITPGGDKLLLRKAAEMVGLVEAAKRVKRAMQFGTRSAKVGNANTGSDEAGGVKRRGKGIGARSVV